MEKNLSLKIIHLEQTPGQRCKDIQEKNISDFCPVPGTKDQERIQKKE